MALAEMAHRLLRFEDGKEGNTSSALGLAKGGRFWRA